MLPPLVSQLKLDARNFSQGLNNAAQEADGFGGRIKSTVGGLSKVFGGLAIAGGAAVVGGIAIVGKEVLDLAGSVQQSTVHLQSALGLTADEAVAMGEVVQGVWANNFGDSIEDVSQAVQEVNQQLGALAPTGDALGSVTERAIAIRDAFGIEVGESLNAVQSLMSNFGLTAEDSLDIVQLGLQEGLNSSGDFLDSIGEYGVQFANAGADASQFYSVMKTGLQAGMLGTDKAADLFKEFRVRIQDGSTSTADGLEKIGIASDDFLGRLADGSLSAVDAFQEIKVKLADVEDSTERFQAGVALFGTQFEDLGEDAVFGLEFIDTSMEDLQGRLGDLDAQYNTWPTMWEGIKRSAIDALTPISKMIMGLAQDVMPKIQEFVQSKLLPAIQEFVGALQLAFSGDLQGGLEALFGEEKAAQIMTWVEAIKQFVDQVVTFVSEHSEAFKGALIAIGAVLGALAIVGVIGAIAAAIATLFSPIGLIVAAVALLGAAWNSNWGGIQEKTQAVIDWLRPFVEGAIEGIKAWWAENGDAILAKAKEIWTNIQTAVKTAIDFVRTTIETAVTAIKAFWAENGEAILAKAMEIWDAISSYLSGIWEVIQGIFDAFRLAFEGEWFAFGEKLREVWELAWKTITEFVGKIWDMIKPLLENLWTTLKGWWDGIDWKSLGEGLINGIKDGVNNAVQWLVDAVVGAAQAALDAAKGFLGIHSPSYLFETKIGRPMLEGMAQGLRDPKPLRTAIIDVIGNVTNRAAIPAPTPRPLDQGLALATGNKSIMIHNLYVQAQSGQDLVEQLFRLSA